MKKLFKLFGLLIITSTILCLSSCGNVFGNKSDDDEIIHDFYNSDKKGYYYYYTSTTTFTYTSPDGTIYDKSNPCIYQICFSQGTNKGTWNMYTRPKATSKALDMIYTDGTYDGDVSKDGEVKLYIAGEYFQTINIETKTIQLENSSPTCCAFSANIIAAHKKINATDSK